MKSIAILFLAIMVIGCHSAKKLSPKDLSNMSIEAPPAGKIKVVVVDDAEKRQPFGTNGGQDFTELCDVTEKKVLFYMRGDFENCEVLQPSHPIRTASEHKTSQGQGGQIVEGAMAATALGVLAHTTRAGSTVVTSTANAISSSGKKGHR